MGNEESVVVIRVKSDSLANKVQNLVRDKRGRVICLKHHLDMKDVSETSHSCRGERNRTTLFRDVNLLVDVVTNDY